MRARPQQPMPTDADALLVHSRRAVPQWSRVCPHEWKPSHCAAVVALWTVVRRSGCIQAVKLRSTCKLFELAIDIDARAAAPIMHRSCAIQHTARH